MRNFKRFSLFMSLVVLVSSFSLNAFACPRQLDWDDIPNILWTDEAMPASEDPVEEVASENGRVEEITEDDLWATPEVSSPTQPEILESRGEAMLMSYGASVASMVTKNYNQPELFVKEGFDAISVFITGDNSNTSYDGKVYFVISGNQWCLYNYKPETAEKYFDKVEDFNGMKVPSKKADSRSDNPTTVSIDETKIPLITRTAFNGMYCNWRSFDEIPFTKDAAGNLLYATYQVNDSGSGDEPSDDKKPGDNPSDKNPDNPNPSENKTENPSQNDPGTPTPSANSSTSSKWYRYTVSLNNGNTYRVFVTRSVSYNGKKHVLTTAKSGKKKTNDIEVYVYLNGQLVEPKLYKVQFKNNKNCTGYGNNEKSIPYFRLKFKFKNKSLKGDVKAMKKKAFGFNISPLDISKGTISYKSVKNGRLKKATWSGNNGVTVKLNPPKGSKGDYTLTNEDGKTVVVGKNNFTGKLAINNSAAPNNNNGNKNNGGGIY